jgi:hypothetical protein
MSHHKLLTVVGAIVIGVGLGCGPSNRPAANGRGGDSPAVKPGEPPKPLPKDELPAAEAKLTALEKTIAAKEKELADLKAEADALRRSIAALTTPKDKVYRTAEGLFADMPKDAYPKAGLQGAVERAACRKWLEEKFVPGQVIEWELLVKDVAEEKDGPFDVYLDYGQVQYNLGAYGLQLGEPISFGDERCVVVMPVTVFGIRFTGCTADEVKRLRTFKGKRVVLRATVAGAILQSGLTIPTGLAIELRVRQLSVDGFIPAASKAKDKK